MPQQVVTTLSTAVTTICSPVVRNGMNFGEAVERSILDTPISTSDRMATGLIEIQPPYFVAFSQSMGKPETCLITVGILEPEQVRAALLFVVTAWRCEDYTTFLEEMLMTCSDSTLRVSVWRSNEDQHAAVVLSVLFEAK